MTQLAQEKGFTRQFVSDTPFRHLVLLHGIDRPGPLRVYIEGDGRPWIGFDRIARDPTPIRPVALELMAADPGPAIYLGRPCYFSPDGLPAPPCTPEHWTFARYGEDILRAMEVALRRIRDGELLSRHLILIGYSGGGVIAHLLAPRIPSTVAVATVAAPMDIDVWTELHGYTPLHASLNPMRGQAVAGGVPMIAFWGGQDRNVPPHLFAESARQRFQARIRIEPTFDHVCCWSEDWPRLLGSVLAVAEEQPAAP